MTQNELIIKYRLERADESIIEAKILTKNGHWNTVANRLYYACFYSVIAILHKNGITTKSHSGARIQLNKVLVKSNFLDIKYGWIYGDLFNKRQESDYKDIKKFTKEEIEPLIPQAEEFIAKIKKLIDAD